MITFPFYEPAIAGIAYSQPDGGAGVESRLLANKWRESVYPHFTAPISRLSLATDGSTEWEWTDSATLAAHRSQTYQAVIRSEQEFVFTSFPGEFEFEDDAEAEDG